MPRQAVRQCLEIANEVAKRDFRAAAHRGDERAQLALFLQHKLLQFVEFGPDCTARYRRPFHRFEAECRTGQELDDAVMKVARKAESRSRFGALLDCTKEGVALNVRRNVRTELLAKIDVIER